MELVGSEEDILNNLVSWDQALMGEHNAHGRGWYHELVKKGVNFIAYQVGREWRFAPSRYIGYKNNSKEQHEQGGIDGRQTNYAITTALDHDPKPDYKRSEQFHGFAARLDISPENKNHKFWTLRKKKEIKDRDSGPECVHPEELPEVASLLEGATTTVCVNRFERSSQLREKCVRALGYKCRVCGFDFCATYGQIGQGFIHVHHLRPLASIGDAHEVNPVDDLVPVCPNCHAMLHRGQSAGNPRTVEELKKLIDAHKVG